MPPEHAIRSRLVVLFFAILSLGLAALNAVNARFAAILRDRARLDYTNTTDIILDTNFQSLQNSICYYETVTAVGTALFAIYGAVIFLNTQWLRKSLIAFVLIQLLGAVAMVVIGGYIADHVDGFQTSFTKFGANDRIPYYSIIYYGNVAQAVYGSVIISLAIMVYVVLLVFDYYGLNIC